MLRFSLVVAMCVTALSSLTSLTASPALASTSTLTITAAGWHLDQQRMPSLAAAVSGSTTLPGDASWEIYATSAATTCPATEPLDPTYGYSSALPGFDDMGGGFEADGASTFSGVVDSRPASLGSDPTKPLALCGYLEETTVPAVCPCPVRTMTATATYLVPVHVQHLAYRNTIHLRPTMVTAEFVCYDAWGASAASLVTLVPCPLAGTLVVKTTQAEARKLRLVSTVIARMKVPANTHTASNYYFSQGTYALPAAVAKKLAGKRVPVVATTTLTSPSRATFSAAAVYPNSYQCYASTTTVHLCAG